MIRALPIPPALLLAGLLVAGHPVAVSPLGAQTAAVGAGSLVIPRPDLGAMEPGPREKIETLQAALEAQLAEGDLSSDRVREGFGFLGQLFHAYELPAAAETCYAQARSLSPEDPRWPYYLGLVRLSAGDLEGAVEALRAVLALTPDDLAALQRLADVQLELGELDTARRLYQRALDLEPERPAALFGLGRVAALSGDPASAAARFERVLELQPEASAVRYPLAQAYRALGERERAELELARRGEGRVAFADPLADVLPAIATSSAFEVVGSLAGEREGFSEESFLGFVLSQLGSAPGAVDQLDSLLASLREGGAPAWQIGRVEYAIGALLVGHGRDVDAVLRFQAAVRGAPDLRDAWVKLGNAQARAGQFEEALAAFDRALELSATDAATLRKRAAALINLGRGEEGVSDLERAVELDPADRQAWTLLAELRQAAGDPQAAVATLQAALEAMPAASERVSLHVALGDLQRAARRFESAAREYLKALRVDEQHVPALSRLASLLGELREFDRAAEVYGRWIAVEPDSRQARMGEASALILGGRFAFARDRLEAGLAAMPGNLDLKDVLARHLAACPDPAVRDGARALELALELYEAVPTPESTETLAMAYAEAGRFEDAVSWQERLIATAADEAADTLRERWQANLELYRKGRACCGGG